MPEASGPAVARNRPVLAGAGRWVRAGGLGIADQALLSITNFLTMLLLARELSPAGFGRFTLAYMAITITSTFQIALIARPHNVLGATLEGRAYQSYTAATAAMQAVFALFTAACALIVGAVAASRGAGMAPLIMTLAPALAAWQTQEFCRRVLFTEGRIGDVVLTDIFSYAGQTLVVAVLAITGRLTGVSALWALAVTSAAGAAVGLWLIRDSLALPLDRSAVGENWRFGRWIAGAGAADWLTGQSYVVLAAALLSVEAAGALRAVGLLFGPFILMLNFLDTILPVQFARTWAAGGLPALRRQVRVALLVVGPVVLVLCLGMALFGGLLLDILYSDAYTGYKLTVALFAAMYVANFLARLAGAAIQAQGRGRPVFQGYLVAGLVAVAVGWLLVRTLGVEGAALGTLISGVVMAAVLWRAYLRDPQASSVARVAQYIAPTGGQPQSPEQVTQP